jgi:hypothetical protein
VDAIPLSLSFLLEPPTAIGRFLAYPSDENFPENFKSENFPPHITTSGTHCTGDWVGPRDDHDTDVKRKNRHYQTNLSFGTEYRVHLMKRREIYYQ